MLSMFLVKDQDSNSTHLISTDFSVLGTVYELKKIFLHFDTKGNCTLLSTSSA